MVVGATRNEVAYRKRERVAIAWVNKVMHHSARVTALLFCVGVNELADWVIVAHLGREFPPCAAILEFLKVGLGDYHASKMAGRVARTPRALKGGANGCRRWQYHKRV